MPHELTAAEIASIEEEIRHRQTEVTPQCIAEVQRTRAFGDLSENDEYRTAKRELNRNYSRIRYLKGLLASGVLVEYASDADEIGLFDRVTIRDEFEEESTVTLVTHLRADILNNKISKDSPLGKALIGHKVGDRVTVQVNETNSYWLDILDLEKGEDDRTTAVN
ncbi:MAG: transcription elongation factor GreA [Ruminococcaceae bacterium]|jgi:transcription elongation factor GreA|nr:transcription elongation factor GreA [Oscillospiraceae bacterium]